MSVVIDTVEYENFIILLKYLENAATGLHPECDYSNICFKALCADSTCMYGLASLCNALIFTPYKVTLPSAISHTVGLLTPPLRLFTSAASQQSSFQLIPAAM